jgi:hypothetical protein
MAKPLDIDTLLGEFSESDSAWTIIDVVSGARLNVPDHARYPGVEVVRFFLSRDDAEKHIAEVIAAAPRLANAVLVAVPVPLIRTARAIAALRDRGKRVGFVVHSPNEVFEAYGN